MATATMPRTVWGKFQPSSKINTTVDVPLEPTDNEDADEMVDEEIPRFPEIYLDNIYMYNIIILIIVVIYTVSYGGLLVTLRSLSNLIYHSYPRLDLAPGTLVNDRTNYFAILLAISATHLPVAFSAIWMLRPITKSIKRTVTVVIISFYIAVDVVTLISVGIAWGLICNNSFGYAPCNAMPLDQCSILGPTLVDRCMPPYPVANLVVLEPTWSFYVFFACLVTLTILEILLLVLTTFLDDEAREYKTQLVFQSRYQ